MFCSIKTNINNFRYDTDLKDSHWMKLTTKEMRNIISETILQDENKEELSPVLYYSSDFLLSPQDWKDLMCIDNEDRLGIDLPFVQLSANLLKRNIILLPILQKDIQDEKLVEEEQKGTGNNDQSDGNNVKSNEEKPKEMKMFLKVNGDETNQTPPITMLYFPGGQFGPDAHYQSINRNHIDKTILKDEINHKKVFDTSKSDFENDESINNLSVDDSDEDDNDDFNTPQKATGGNAYNQTTMLTPQDPAATVILNETNKTERRKLKRDKNAPVYVIAPGEGKIPEDWLREKSFDIEAFPHLFPNGKFGMHSDRPKKLTPSKYFPQRITNENNMFAKDHDYIFMAQQFLERYALERQINMSALNGCFVETEDNDVKMKPTDDKFAIFQSIPGTPAYWKKFRSEASIY